MHRVRISKPFYLGKYEVTQQEWTTSCETIQATYSPTGKMAKSVAGEDTDHFPVGNVTWFDRAEFCNRLSAKKISLTITRLMTIFLLNR